MDQTQEREFNRVVYLLNADADPNLADNGGITPLMVASHYGDTKIVRKLLEHGAKRDLKDKEGRTAVDYARVAEKYRYRRASEYF